MSNKDVGGFLMLNGLIFRNREFKINDILEIFSRECNQELFNGYEKYCNLAETQEHLQTVIDT